MSPEARQAAAEDLLAWLNEHDGDDIVPALADRLADERAAALAPIRALAATPYIYIERDDLLAALEALA